MSYYILPKINFNLKPENLKLNFDTKEENIFINKRLAFYLEKVKININKYIHLWDDYKKSTNPYEFIHTNIPHTKSSISKIKPISRSFFKIIEITHIFHIFEIFAKKNINSYHLAEGPGGFIEGFIFMRKNPNDKHFGMTLIDKKNSKVPGWRKAEAFLLKHKNVSIETGADGTGNLYHAANLQYCMDNHQNSMDVITADGGFDFSTAFEKQENSALRLIFSQIAFAITMQKKNGHFMLKVFDIFHRSTVELIFILSCCYEKVYIIKPHTSRVANSEKYIVCKFFKYSNSSHLSQKFLRIFKVLEQVTTHNIISWLNIKMQRYYINQLTEFNAIYGQQQIENIIKTQLMIEQSRYDNINNNIQKCIQWCSKYNIPYNKGNNTKNIFLRDVNRKK